MTVHVSAQGAGTSPVELHENATVAALLAIIAPDFQPTAFRVRVNRLTTRLDHVLRSGDRVAVTPISTSESESPPRVASQDAVNGRE